MRLSSTSTIEDLLASLALAATARRRCPGGCGITTEYECQSTSLHLAEKIPKMY